MNETSATQAIHKVSPVPFFSHPIPLDEIRTHIESSAKDTVLAKIELGRWLQMARDHFKADQDFGEWRQENIPWMSEKVAGNHISVYRKFGPKLTSDRLPNFTILRELAKDTTPEVTVEKVLKDPEGWTVKDVKEQIKADREDIEGPPPKREIVTDYEKAWRILSGATEATAARVCHNWLAQAGASSEVVSKDKLQKHIRKLSQMAHPDKGGSEELMIAINQMKKELLG